MSATAPARPRPPPSNLVLAHEQRRELSHYLLVQHALLIGLHIGQVVPQAHPEAGIRGSRILDEQATAEPLARLALDDVPSIGAIDLASGSGSLLTRGDRDHHGRTPSRSCPGYTRLAATASHTRSCPSRLKSSRVSRSPRCHSDSRYPDGLGATPSLYQLSARTRRVCRAIMGVAERWMR